ncbi:TPA: hypothetical protein DCW38_05785, partial [candidate division WOR-3 bacterium]|nr:hypothetical protein [candidate division WOR-3 bacterium]
MQNKRNLIISAGGTGGHIIPALTIGLSLQNVNPIFICGRRDIEKTVYENFNVKPILLNLNSFSFVSFIFSLPKNIMTAVKILIDKNPQSV